jgi:hypothetical protein
MAETITYPDAGYGIMPIDSLNRYLKFENQRRATTGITAPASDKKAFWEGTMDSVVKNSAVRAAQNLENKKYDQSVINADRNYGLAQEQMGISRQQLENQEDASKRAGVSSLAQIPLTYMMYDALGLRKPGKKGFFEGITDWGKETFGGNSETASVPYGVVPAEGYTDNSSDIGRDYGYNFDYASGIEAPSLSYDLMSDVPSLMSDVAVSSAPDAMQFASDYVSSAADSVFGDWWTNNDWGEPISAITDIFEFGV